MTTHSRILTLACALGMTLTACDSIVDPDTPVSPETVTGSRGRPGAGIIVTPPNNQRIVFHSFTTSYPDGGFDLYAMNPDGSNVERLTSTLDQDVTPAVSPDGSKIAFVRIGTFAPGQKHVFVKDMYPILVDGTDVIQLTFEGTYNEDPTWSPDGSRIAFSSNRDGHYDLYMMAPDGSGVERLTDNPGAYDGDPAWSPDGTRIAFTSFRDGNLEIYVLSQAGNGTKQNFKHLTRLTDHGGADRRPTWSPDGTRIAFESNRAGNYEIYSMNADGTDVVRLTFDPAEDGMPAWSLGGSRIAFESNRDGNYELYAMNVDGTNVTRLTDNPMYDSAPAWAKGN